LVNTNLYTTVLWSVWYSQAFSLMGT
jgi:hypothetical protein